MRRDLPDGRWVPLLVVLAIMATAGLVACQESTTTPTSTTHTPTQAGELHQPGPPVVRQPVHVVPVPSSSGTEGKADGRVQAGGASCGRERWNVKVATDPAAAGINLTPKTSTVEALGAIPSTNTSGNLDEPRSAAEQQTYTVTAMLEGAKVEADSDIHLVLSDNGHTMIAEIPKAPACTEPPITAGVSVLEQQIESARASFVQHFGEPSSSGFTPINHKVTVTGVLFFDVRHGQRGVAPNAAELHPLTALSDP